MKNLLISLVAVVAIALLPQQAQSQAKPQSQIATQGQVTAHGQMATKCNVYQFEYPIMLPATPVKNQAVTGTCWSFATTSLFESELMRTGKGVYELSEMFTVRYNYINRVNDNFIKQGKGNLGEGSLSNMVLNVVNEYGMVPLEVYEGINYHSKTHNHSELNASIQAIAAVPVMAKTRSPQFNKTLNAILDNYLGEAPEKFNYKGKEYTPLTFFKNLGINTDHYILLTSFSHHPYYSNFVLEIPDNWNSGSYHNLPLDQFMQVIDNALKTGYTVGWDGDMSEKSYSDPMGIAVNATQQELESEPGRKLSFNRIYQEETVTQENRQAGFESTATTDDHLMHLIGNAKDKNGTTYYVVKNSWKPETNRFGGYNHLSREYVKAKTISIIVHKDAIPKAILNKLNL
ncbi:MAG: C1 family peptidase [Bacteroidales bacterium]